MKISQPNQVLSLRNFQEIFLWVSKNELNKSKNTKKNNFICKIKSNHCETFWKSLCGHPKTIQTKINNNKKICIVIISAKEIPIFMKLSGTLPVGIQIWFKKKKQKKTKRERKKLNNIFYLSQTKSNIYKIFRKCSVGYSKIIQTKDKNKHFFQSTISQPSQVKNLWNFH